MNGWVEVEVSCVRVFGVFFSCLWVRKQCWLVSFWATINFVLWGGVIWTDFKFYYFDGKDLALIIGKQMPWKRPANFFSDLGLIWYWAKWTSIVFPVHVRHWYGFRTISHSVKEAIGRFAIIQSDFRRHFWWDV